MKKTNPRKIPATPEKTAEESDRAYYLAIANVLDTVAETGRYTIDEIDEAWEKINTVCNLISDKKASLPKMLDDLKAIGIDIQGFGTMSLKPRTMAEVKRNARIAYGLACAIMLWTFGEDKRFSTDELRELWKRVQYKRDSVQRKYTTLRDIVQALYDDYGIRVGAGRKF